MLSSVNLPETILFVVKSLFTFFLQPTTLSFPPHSPHSIYHTKLCITSQFAYLFPRSPTDTPYPARIFLSYYHVAISTFNACSNFTTTRPPPRTQVRDPLPPRRSRASTDHPPTYSQLLSRHHPKQRGPQKIVSRRTPRSPHRRRSSRILAKLGTAILPKAPGLYVLPPSLNIQQLQRGHESRLATPWWGQSSGSGLYEV